jgi:hypothetical protein
MTDTSRRKPAANVALHAVARQMVFLAATRKRTPPELADGSAAGRLRQAGADGRAVEGHAVVAGMSHDNRALDDFVFQRGNAERSLAPVCLRNPRPTNRFGSVRSPLEPLGQVPEIFFQALAVAPPRLAIDSRGRFPLNLALASPQPFDVVEIMQERGEPLLPVSSGNLTYPLKRALRVLAALSPGRVLLKRVSLGQSPSLHCLQSRFLGFVRQLSRYYGIVHLSACNAQAGLSACNAQAGTASAPRSTRHSRIEAYISQLHTRPAPPHPVNASTSPLRTTAHDSGPNWAAHPCLYDSLIHYTLPV